MNKRIVVVGAGAVGGYAGGRMAQAGHDVTLIDPWPEHVEYIRAHGLQLSGMTPEERQSVKVNTMHITDVQSLSRQKPVDIAFICTKSYDTEWAAHLIKQYLARDGYVVSLQNCINEERIANVVGWGKVLGCVAALIAVELYKPGHIMRTVPLGGARHTVFRAGEPHGRITSRSEEVAGLLRAVDSAKATTNLWGERWSKLTVNVARNALSAVTGMSGNERDTQEAPRWVSIRLGGEAIKVGRALGFQLELIHGAQSEDIVAAADGDGAALKRVVEILEAGARNRSDEQRPSMGQDIRKGRRTEIDYINGLVVEKGREAGIATPVNAAMVQLLKRVERGDVKPGPGTIAGL